MLIKPIERSCLACGCSDFEVVHQNQLATLDGIDLSSSIGLCSECGQLQAHCLAPPAQYDNYYQRLSKTDFSETLSALDEARICEAVKLCREHSQPGAKVADLGCGSGDLLARLQINGFCPVLGIDPGAGSALQAKRQHGLTVVISSYRSQESLATSLAQSWPNAICRLYPYPAVQPRTHEEAVTAYASA